MKFSAIILAAGYSSRMGSMKMLLPMDVCNMLERTIGSFLAAGIRDIYVVTGFEAEKIEACAIDMGVHSVRNPDFANGMFSSVQAGVKALSKDIDAFFVMPGDIPFVDPRVIRELAAKFTPDSTVIYPRFEGRKGHPPIISAKLCDEIANANVHMGCGLKGVLGKYDHLAVYLDFADAALLVDLDYQEDYRKATLNYVGDMSTPVAMLTIGASVSIESIRKNPGISVLGAALKTIITPLVVTPIAAVLGFRGLSLAIIAISAACPTATTTHALAKGFQCDEA